LNWLSNCRFFTVSIFVHAIIVLMGGSVVLFHVVPEPPDFVAGSDGVLVQAADSTEPPAAPKLSQAVSQQFTPEVPTMATLPLSAIVTTAPQVTTFSTSNVSMLGTSDAMKSAMASINSNRLGEAAGAAGSGLGRLGGMSRISFFGMKTEAKRIAFLVDYSGSMEGPFRKEMEQELERSLRGLPAGTQILIIPWAGGAWRSSELATDIADKWEKVGGDYDNFIVRPNQKLSQPDWVPINPDNITKLLKGVAAQKSWSGGTDWRSPFRYAMEANPPPDTIFFMTDGQIQNVDRAFDGIDHALKKTNRQPRVFSLWIPNKQFKPDHLKALASKYGGEFREVKPDAKAP
jgi:hypothetical protein